MHRELLQYDPVVGYRFTSGIRARIHHSGGGYLLATNSAGFRSHHEFVPAKVPNTFRILLFGDSYTAGDGVSDSKRYGNLLEKQLPRVEIFNFGLPGSGTDQQYLAWREYAAGIDHDLVVIGALVENIRRVAARYRPFATREGTLVTIAKPYFSLDENGSLSLHNVPVPKAPLSTTLLSPDERPYIDRGGRFAGARRLVNRFASPVKEPLQRLTRFQPVPAYADPRHPDWLLMKSILERWVAEIEAPVVIVPIPLYHYVEGTASARHYQARFRELASPPHVTVHDPLPDFLRFPKAVRRRFRFGADCHLTPEGHSVLAASVARALAPLLENPRI